ncbi:MAG TPA: lytic transglycosylase domain-containing protein [Streptosporangiaceae bacterium]|nr:lytic transglycosylase domain-containing protein [Streptosporangiaceae bacterium]
MANARHVRWAAGESLPCAAAVDAPDNSSGVFADERIALSRHRTGARSSRRKGSFLRRNGVILPVAVVAAIAVAAVSVAAWVMGPSASGASGAAAAMEAIPNSHTVALLEQERQQMIAMSEASRTLTVVARPKLTSPQSAASSSSGGSSSGGSSSSGTSSSGGTSGSSAGTTVPVVVAAAPAPGTAKSIAYSMMSSFGFPTSEFGCLDALWTRESGWIYDAENASGAYGIPQSLPGSKMASAGADWQTNPSTQIKWGLGYIQQVYGNPCAAWNFELANGYY